MLPYEYSIVLSALKKLKVNNINVYIEGSTVHDHTLNGHVHRIG